MFSTHMKLPTMVIAPYDAQKRLVQKGKNFKFSTFFFKKTQNSRFSTIRPGSIWADYTTKSGRFAGQVANKHILEKILTQKFFPAIWWVSVQWSIKRPFWVHFFQKCAWCVQHVPAAPATQKWIGHAPHCSKILESGSRTQQKFRYAILNKFKNGTFPPPQT